MTEKLFTGTFNRNQNKNLLCSILYSSSLIKLYFVPTFLNICFTSNEYPQVMFLGRNELNHHKITFLIKLLTLFVYFLFYSLFSLLFYSLFSLLFYSLFYSSTFYSILYSLFYFILSSILFSLLFSYFLFSILSFILYRHYFW